MWFYNKQHNNPTTANIWAPQAILLFWKYTRSLWIHRNQIVHGKDVEEAAARILQELQDVVRQLYESFDTNPAIRLPRHHYLFTTRSLEQCLQMPYDNITCWLHSVEEAQQALALHESLQHRNSSRFFPQYHADNHDSSDDSYVPCHPPLVMT